jgi:crotonobetainyl-CoA:carnitine CoA-transferase CaiB-like acyl-CoA transferase
MAQLEGIRVVDLSTFLAAPSCGRILANMGAEVIHVEAPRGDDVRVVGPSYKYPAAQEGKDDPAMDAIDAVKKGLCLNLKDPEGHEAFMKLLETADVFLTNNRVQALKKMGLDYDTLHAKFPRLIHASILGYGEKGPLKDKPGFDYTSYFSRGGVAYSMMEKGTKPAVPISGFGDYYAGIALAAGTLGALVHQQKTGEGERVTVCLFDAAIYGLGWMMGGLEYGNTLPASRKHTNSPTATTYETKDGRWIQLAMLQYDKSLPAFVKVSGADWMLTDPRFSTFKEALKNITPLVDALEPVFAQYTLKEWDQKLTEADIPYEIVQTIEEVATDEQAWANDYIYTREQPDGKKVNYVRTPIFFTERPSLKDEEAVHGRAPLLGEDSTEILKSIGYSDEKIKEWIAKGVVKEVHEK